MENFEEVKEIGSGNFGVAHLLHNRKTQELDVVKYIERGPKFDENVKREIINHQTLRHPNIIRFKQAWMDGTLSLEEFKSSCDYMINAWSAHYPHLPQWQWRESGSYSLKGEGFLVLEDWPFEHTCDPKEVQTSGSIDEADRQIDGATDLATIHSSECGVHSFTYHIVYNNMYRVPKLFLKGRYHDGQPLNWQDVLQILPAGLSDDSAKWTFLTYEEHPYLHNPWLALHPCGTSELMRMVFTTLPALQAESGSQDDSESYACPNQNANRLLPTSSGVDLYNMTWLSFVSQAVALKLPKQFFQCFVWR